MNKEDLRYPIGQWEKPAAFDTNKIAEQISVIAAFPSKLKEKINSFSEEQLEKTYRDGGWTARQVVHHCADSHMNAFIRFKLALTEDKPTIKPYAEAKWAELADAKTFPVNVSVQLLESLHARWTVLLKSLTDAQWNSGFIHPEHGGELKLFETVSLYAWHCEHHFAHISLIN
jgi:hypothetical protein